MQRAIPWAILLVALLPSLWFAWTARELPHLGHFHDDGIYLTSAASMAAGHGYRVASAPGEPVQTRFPPLFPAYLAPFVNSRALLLGAVWVLCPCFLALTFFWAGEMGFGDLPAAGVCLALGANVYVMLFSASLMSEMLALSLLLAAFYLIEQDRAASIVLAGFAAAAAYLTRTSLIAAVVGLFLYLLLRRRWSHAVLFALLCFPAIVIWDSFVSTNADPHAQGAAVWYTNYLGFYRQNVTVALLPTIVWKNFQMLLQSAGGLLFFNNGDSMLDVNIARLFVFAAVAGLVRLRQFSGYHAFAVLYSGGLLIWNYVPNDRLVLPLLPLLLVGLFTELGHFAGMLRGAWGRQRAAAVVLGGLVGGGLVWAGVRDVQGIGQARDLIARYRAYEPVRNQVYMWIDAHTPLSARFLAYDEPSLYFYTRRHGYGMHFPTRLYYANDRAGMVDFFAGAPEIAREEGLDYLVLTPWDFEQDLSPEERMQVRRRILASRGLEPVYDHEGILILRVHTIKK